MSSSTTLASSRIAATVILWGFLATGSSVHAATDYTTAGRWDIGGGYFLDHWFDNNFSGTVRSTVYQSQSWSCKWNIPANNFLSEVLVNIPSIYVDTCNPWASAYHKQSIGAGTTGNGWLPCYGWLWLDDATNVEFYIIDDWWGGRPTQGGQFFQGTIVMDGGTYDIYHVPKYGYGSYPIWNQWWSIRRNLRKEGGIYYVQHFKRWRQFGMANLPLTRLAFAIEPGRSGSGQVNYEWVTLNQP